MKKSDLFIKKVRDYFNSPLGTWQQWLWIIAAGLVAAMLPQKIGSDWEMNTQGLWSTFPDIYDLPYRIYPPWSVILFLPYYWMRAQGTAFLSVMTIGWLIKRRGWTLSQFTAIFMSPLFLTTMNKANLDILVMVFPILLWEVGDGKRWQSLAWGTALSLSLIKPQGMVFVGLYWLAVYGRRWKEWLVPAVIVLLVTVPISLIGHPPLVVQWIDNILHPAAQGPNWLYWTTTFNNLSWTDRIGWLPGIAAVAAVSGLVYLAVRRGLLRWTRDHWYASLHFLSFFLMPYASQQSASSGLCFLPSWYSTALHYFVIIFGVLFFGYEYNLPYFHMLYALAALFLFQVGKPAKEIEEDGSDN